MKAVIIAIGLLVVGFVFLIKGADFFVEGSSAIARKFRVPPLIIGMTIVAMGTSLPELSVSLSASMHGSNALAVSNVVGSNIFNLMVVLGMSAIISRMDVSDDVLRRDFPFSILCAAMLLILGYFGMSLGHADGVILLAVFVVFLCLMVRSALSARRTEAAADDGLTGDSTAKTAENTEEISILKNIIFIVGGALAIKFGGDWVVSGATTIARAVGITENLIGLTIVACGTSLPELVTSMVAAKKDELDMAVGNAVGSNVFNILLILGTAAAVSPIAFITENVIDIGVLIAFSALTWVFSMTEKRLDRKEGVMMVTLYVVYLVYICIR